MANKKQIKSRRKNNIILFTLISCCLLICVVFLILRTLPNKEKEPHNVKIVEHLDNYGYILYENESTYYNQLFKELKETLNRKDFTEEEYATLIVRLFASDFFHLENKITKSDIGGTQFVYEPYRSDFESYAKKGMYKYIENNIYGDRKQELPSVEQVSIDKMKQDKFTYQGITDANAYFVDIVIQFNKDLGYRNTYQLILIHNQDKLEIAKLS